MTPAAIAARARLLWRAWRYRLRLDPGEIAFLLEHLRPGDCAVDVGAHKGGYTWWMQRAVGASGRVLAFEPQPELAAGLRAALTAAGVGHVTVENAAVSDRAGTTTLVIPDGGSSCGATLEPRETASRSYAVETVTLDGYVADRPGLRVALLKVDVEGHEASVFRGAARILAEHRPALLFECEARHHRDDTVDDVFRLLVAAGYEGWFFLGRTRRPLAEFGPELQAAPGRRPYVNDFLFLPRERGGVAAPSVR